MSLKITNMKTDILKQYISPNVDVTWHDNVAVFEVPITKIISVANDLYTKKNLSLKLITATDERKEGRGFNIWYVFGVPEHNIFIVPFIQLGDTEEFPSLTPLMRAAWDYERKIQTFFGLAPIGHPDARPIILHENWPTNIFPLRKDFDGRTQPPKAHGTYQFQKVDGEGIYEIPVGPIHAGIIEPGHFRFSVAGEEIMLLEARLGFTHKGSEKLFESLPLSEQVHLAEKISGDSSFAHSLAFCEAVERLGNCAAPKRARALRVLYAELERLANHFGDIGAMMLDTGFNFGGANGARLREMIMQINEQLTGSRFLRGVNIIGGVTKDMSIDNQHLLARNLQKIEKDFSEVIAIAGTSAVLLNRFMNAGTLSPEIVRDFGVVGIAAKAAGVACDARVDFPYAAYDEFRLHTIATENSGDAWARFYVRVKEVHATMKIVQRILQTLSAGPIAASFDHSAMKKNAVAVSMVEGWRGEIIYFLRTNEHGNITRVAPRDPSFVNWPALGEAGAGNVVPDFPLINKSFNLSYSGNDL